MERYPLWLANEPPLNRIPGKPESCIRYLTFNVNGVKTLFNHHPWNQLQNGLCGVFAALQADIISLQELKIQSSGVAERSIAEGYKSFISISKAKKGYSGVGLYVRTPSETDAPSVQQALTVIKAEEGITGCLKSSGGTRYRDLSSSETIGGYVDDEMRGKLELTEEDCVALDSQGRCVVIETANNTVIVSLYCPANSQGTEEGQKFRLHFLAVMLDRCSKLKHMGKEVVIMGDINVSPDLIDNAEAINDRLKLKAITNNLRDGGDTFEEANNDECLAFRSSAEHRELLNKYVRPTLKNAPLLPTQLFYDTTRWVQKRKLNLYTVWNTQTNARQSNYGSRIDLILMSSQDDVNNIKNADILSYILGSDHCPVFTDVDVNLQPVREFNAKKLTFEAHSFYKLVKHYDISSIFKKAGAEKPTPAISKVGTEAKSVKRTAARPVYTDRKKPKQTHNQQPINNFFFPNKFDKHNQMEGTAQPVDSILAKKQDIISTYASKVYTKPPSCEHNEPCILKTSMTPQTKGKKFWCCARESKGSSVEFGEHRCNFFDWAKRPT